MKFYLFTTLMFIAGISHAQTGQLTGKVQSESGLKVTSAKIFALGQKDTATSDMEGRFRLILPAGEHEIIVQSKLFAEFNDSVIIKTGDETFLNPVLATIQSMGTTVIRGVRKAKQNTVSGAIRAKQLDTRMVEVIGAEEFKKTTIRTTSDALKRIPGATIMEGKFANIRGMFDRYNAGYLNGAPLPSTETDRKAFSFDVIPASLLDNIVVIKSGTPDLIGDFGGGIIRINTKSIPDKLTQTFNFGLQYNSITTFRDIEQFPTQGSETFGIPGSNRQLPQINGVLSPGNPAEKNVEESKKFNNDWTITTSRPMLAPRISYSIGIPFKLPKKRELGLLVSLNYSLTQKYSDGVIIRNDISDNRNLSRFEDRLYSSNVQNGGIMNLSLKLNDKNRIDWRNLYTITYDANSTLRSGVANADDGVTSDGSSNLINYNRLASTQINGTHVIGEKQTTITWLLNYGNTNREVPDFRIGQYASIDGTRYLVLNDFFNAGSGRFFSNLNENTFSASGDVQHSIQLDKLTTNIKYGLFYQNRNRQFASREFVYGPVGKTIVSDRTAAEDLGHNSISSTGVYLIEKTSTDADEYNGTSSLKAAYLMAEHHYPLFKSGGKAQNLKVIYGLRAEQFNQFLTNEYFDQLNRRVADGGVNNDLLPSLNIIAPVTGKTGIRLAYYKTVNRPEMREMAPFSFYNFNLNSEIVGNVNLRRAILHNFDFRYEIFPGKEDMLSIGAFTKRIINPIEFSLRTDQPAIRTFGYENEKSALIYGTELELRKSLAFIGKVFAPQIFHHLSLYGNLAIIKSAVQFKTQSSGMEERPLQGQSPFVVNISAFYEDKSGFNASLNWNKLGDRIAYIGVAKSVQPFGTNIYEYGRSMLDFQIGKNFKKAGNFKLTFGDILKQNTVFYQDLNSNKKYDEKGDNTLFKFTNGTTVTFGYSYTF